MAASRQAAKRATWTGRAVLGLLLGLAVLMPATTSAATQASPTPVVTWTLAHNADTEQPLPITWTGRHLGQKHRLVVQRRVGTAKTWKTVLRLRANSGSTELPGLPLGKYRFRLADLDPIGRVLAQQVVGIGVFGPVPFSVLFGGSEQVVAGPTFTFPFITENQLVSASSTAFTVSHNHCESAHIAFVPTYDSKYPGAGTITVVQESAAPVSATTPTNTIGGLDVALVPGQSWSVSETKSTSSVEPVFHFNGSAVCDSTEPFSS